MTVAFTPSRDPLDVFGVDDASFLDLFCWVKTDSLEKNPEMLSVERKKTETFVS